MRIFFALIMVLLVPVSVVAQTKDVMSLLGQLESVTTEEQARKFLHENRSVKGYIMTYNPLNEEDYSDAIEDIHGLPEGQIRFIDTDKSKPQFIFKSLQPEQSTAFRVNYIFLNRANSDMKAINKKRAEIMARLKAGEKFEDVAAIYTMDSNAKTGGDIGWFEEGKMMAEFETEVKKRNLGEIYNIDIPAKGWHYIVKNTHPPQKVELKKVLYLDLKPYEE